LRGLSAFSKIWTKCKVTPLTSRVTLRATPDGVTMFWRTAALCEPKPDRSNCQVTELIFLRLRVGITLSFHFLQSCSHIHRIHPFPHYLLPNKYNIMNRKEAQKDLCMASSYAAPKPRHPKSTQRKQQPKQSKHPRLRCGACGRLRIRKGAPVAVV